MEDTELAKAMAAKGLVRAQIKTLKGNTVWRWVKPDNPNIVGAVKTVAKAAVEAVKDTTRKAVEAVKDIIDEAQVSDWEPGFKAVGFPSCCGASILQPQKATNGGKKTEAEWQAEWECSYDYQQYHTYIRSAENYESKIKGTTDTYYIGQWQRYVKDYRAAAESTYSLQAFIKKGGQTRGGATVKDYKSPGICISAEKFPNSKRTPAGLWVRQDRAPVSKAKDDHFEAAAVVDFDAVVKYAGHYATQYKAYMDSKSSGANYHILTGMDCGPGLGLKLWKTMAPGKQLPGYNIYNDASKNVKFLGSWEVGDVVVFILNNSQRNGHGVQTPKNLAAAGFTETLRTGNTNHPGSSTLYLYERTLTAADIEGMARFANGQ